MKTLLFLLKGFETMEFSPFVDVMGWARNVYRLDADVVTCGFQKDVTSAFKIPITADKTIAEIDVEDFDALAIPGGFGEYGFFEEAFDNKFLDLIKEFDENNKAIAAVCVGALPVGKSGVLVNRKATTYHLDGGRRQAQLRNYGAEVSNQPIVIDGNIITSSCPETAPGVAFCLLEKLTSKEKMERVKKAMGFAM